MMDVLSIMVEMTDLDLNHRIGERVRTLRSGRALSLEALAQKSGVSRSMLSVIERGQSSPTAIVLEKIASALDVSLASLFENPCPKAPDPLSRRAAQATWTDPASGYVRRNVSPDSVGSPIQIVEVDFPANATVAYENGATRGTTVHQQVLVLAGLIDFTSGETTYRLDAGDCVACTLDKPTAFHNPTAKPARYLVVLTSTERPRP